MELLGRLREAALTTLGLSCDISFRRYALNDCDISFRRYALNEQRLCFGALDELQNPTLSPSTLQLLEVTCHLTGY